jgi:hypothetical protein
MRRLIQRASLLFAAVICVAPSAQAQNPRARGPFAGLFGGGARAENSETLDFRTSLFGVRSDVILPPDFDRSLLDPRFDLSGTFGAVSGFLDYAFDRHTESSTAFVVGRAWTSDYSSDPAHPQFGAQALAGLTQNVRLTRRMTLASSASAAYTPFFEFGALTQALSTGQQNIVPGAAIPGAAVTGSVVPLTATPGLGFAGVPTASVAMTATTGLSEALSRRSAVSGNLSFQRIFFLTESSGDVTALNGTAVYTHQLLRRLYVSAGYQAWEARVSNPPAWSGPTQSLYFGLDYGDGGSIKLTRRTTLTFGGGLGSARAVPGNTLYRAVGNIGLQRSFGRTWIGYLGAGRSLTFVAAFREPVLFDSAVASFGGQFLTRVSWMTSATVARGYIGLDSSRHYDTFFGASVLSFGITRWLQAFAQYGYYRSTVPTGSTPLSVLTNLDRRTISAGLSLYTPIYHSRRPTP